MIKNLTLILISVAWATAAGAQAVDATKETGKAVSEKTKQGADNTKAAFESGGDKAADKTKAAVHGAKSKYHKHKAKKAADAAVH